MAIFGEGEKSNKTKIIIILVCFAAAVVIFGIQFFKGGPTAEGSIWMKCNNPACKAEYEITIKAFEDYQKDHPGIMIAPGAWAPPAMPCKQCDKESLFQAKKCEKCSKVFIVRLDQQFSDKCSECGYSPTEENIKASSGQ